MIKLSKIQTEIEGLANKVPQLTKTQLSWAVKDYTYFQWVKSTDTEVHCPNCKDRIPIPKSEPKKDRHDDSRDFRCPHCGAKISVSNYDNGYNKSQKRNYLQEGFFQVLSAVGDWQVTRLIYMQRYCYIRKENTEWQFFECCQAWHTPRENKTYFRALPKKMMPGWYCYNPYSLHQWGYEENPETGSYSIYKVAPNELEPRKVNGSNYFDTKHIAPQAKILPYYEQRGLTIEFLKENIRHSALGWFQYFGQKHRPEPMMETIIKSGDYDFLKKMSSRWRNNDDAYCVAWKIAKRHHYKIKDLSEWFDLIDMLVDCEMDYRSPHYVCPTDFAEMHAQIVGILNRKRERERRLAEEKHRREQQDLFKDIVKERITKFGDLVITNGTLHAVVIITYDDYHDEGRAMHHCVGGYFARRDSLILSMRDNDGKRVETVEVNLTTFTIIQSHGACNEDTPRHEEIIDLVNSNMEQIRQRYKIAS